jgi:Cu/Ag efflux pump CusA
MIVAINGECVTGAEVVQRAIVKYGPGQVGGMISALVLTLVVIFALVAEARLARASERA